MREKVRFLYILYWSPLVETEVLKVKKSVVSMSTMPNTSLALFVGSTPGRVARYQVVTTWIGDCLRTGKPSRYITNTKVNSALHPSRVGKSSTGLHGWG